jgi:hypothetical protein
MKTKIKLHLISGEEVPIGTSGYEPDAEITIEGEAEISGKLATDLSSETSGSADDIKVHIYGLYGKGYSYRNDPKAPNKVTLFSVQKIVETDGANEFSVGDFLRAAKQNDA